VTSAYVIDKKPFGQSKTRNTIRALQTTLCGVFRSRTSRSNRSRSATLIEIRTIFLVRADSQVRAPLRIVSQQRRTKSSGLTAFQIVGAYAARVPFAEQGWTTV
jgi:hypothetical protein